MTKSVGQLFELPMTDLKKCLAVFLNFQGPKWLSSCLKIPRPKTNGQLFETSKTINVALLFNFLSLKKSGSCLNFPGRQQLGSCLKFPIPETLGSCLIFPRPKLLRSCLNFARQKPLKNSWNFSRLKKRTYGQLSELQKTQENVPLVSSSKSLRLK